MRGIVAALVAAALLSACSSTNPRPDQIVAAFIAASQDPARTMHVEWQMTFTSITVDPNAWPRGPDDGTIVGSFDFNGADYVGELSSPTRAIVPARSYSRVGGATYINLPEQGWRLIKHDYLPGELDPLLGLTPLDVEYEAADSLDGREVQRLRVTDGLMSLQRNVFRVMDLDPDAVTAPGGRSDYFVYVDDNGIPVAAHAVLDVSSVPIPETASPLYSSTFLFEYQFSKWGDPVMISQPSPSWPPLP